MTRTLTLALRLPALLWMLACRAAPSDPVEVVPREPGDRSPLTGLCDPTDPLACTLPWPSSTFLRKDTATATGLRVAVDPRSLPVEDDPSYLNLGDGFSRVTGVAAGFYGPIRAEAVSWDPASSLQATSTLQVINLQPGHPDRLRRYAFRTEWVDLAGELDDRWLLIGRPVEVLPADADLAWVVLDEVNDEPAPRDVLVALGLVEPADSEEAARQGYFAPVAAGLEEAGVPLERVVRVADFTTRSAGDATRRMHHLIDTLDASLGDLAVEIESMVVDPSPNVAAIVRGRLTGAPGFLDADGHLLLDADGLPQVAGSATIEFRASLPHGPQPYKVALYGHGTGGDVTDPAFDDELAEIGVAKLAVRFDGWTGDDFVFTLVNFSTFFDGSARSTAGLMQSLAGGTVLLTALDGLLGEALAAPTLAGQNNPLAGVYPDTEEVVWLGGSMGGTMGAVVVSADPRLQTAVLNVPGAGWTHMVPSSLLYQSGMESIMSEVYTDPLDLTLAVLQAQNCWDDVDGAVWGDEALAAGGTFLLQQSMDDPILPNLGTELLANALQATLIEPALQPVVGLPTTTEPLLRKAGLEQFRVPNTGQYDVHGFAARDTLAGDAALEQILHLLVTAWDGQPEIRHPELCRTTNFDESCDFSGMW